MIPRDSENMLRIIDDTDIKTSTEKRLSNHLESENKTEIEKMKEDIGGVSQKKILSGE